MNSTAKKIIVFGGTGHYGLPIVKKLVEKGESVKVLSRNAHHAKSKLGNKVEIIEGDVTRKETIIESLKNVKALVICLSAAKRKLIRKIKAIEYDAVLMIMDEAKKANINRLVYLSVYELRKEVLKKLGIYDFGKLRIELESHISNSDFNWTILGNAPSFELFFTLWQNNKVAVPGGGEKAIPAISPCDVGEIAAQTVVRDDLNRIRLLIFLFRDLTKQR